jgi:hypothetical protein
MKRIAIACFLTIITFFNALSKDIYVSPKGNNQFPGTREKPIQSISLAKKMAYEYLKSGKDGKLTVWLADGIYSMAEPLVFEPFESSSSQAALLFKSLPGAKPIISGGMPISQWSKRKDGLWECHLPNLGKKGVRELFVNGKRAMRARFPNHDFLRVKKAGEDKRTNFYFEKGDFPIPSKASHVELVFMHDWSITRIGVKEIHSESDQLVALDQIGAKNLSFFTIDNWEAHPRYYLENSMEFMDLDFEWVYEPDSKKIVIKLPSKTNPSSLNIVIPISEGLISLVGKEESLIKNIQFDGITFQYAKWDIPASGYSGIQATFFDPRDEMQGWNVVPAAITAVWGDQLVFSNCMFKNLGGTAILLGAGCRRSKVSNSTFDDISGNGIMIGEGQERQKNGNAWFKSAPEQVASGNTIEHCIIKNCGSQYFCAVGIWAGLTAKTTIRNNEIFNLPYTGISIGWMWSTETTPCEENIIDGNHIHHIMNTLSDGGGIYMLGLQPRSILSNNHIHDVKKNAGSAESNGMFLDEGITDLRVENNLIYRIAKSPIRFHKATKNLVQANLLFCQDGNPPIRYNRTKEEEIQKVNNEVLVKGQIGYDEVLKMAIDQFSNQHKLAPKRGSSLQ